MKQSKRTCKGRNKAKGFDGCGKLCYPHRYGLCLNCWKAWLISTDEGQAYIQRNTIPKAKKQVRAAKQKQKREDAIRLMSVDEYRAKELQPVVNEIVRIIDNGQPCIAQPTLPGTDAGHFVSVGSNRTLSLHFDNIHLQSRHSNSYKGGDSLLYYKGLARVYGKSYADYCDSLRRVKPVKLTKLELIEIRVKLMHFRSKLRKQITAPIKASKRLELRKKANEVTGVFQLL